MPECADRRIAIVVDPSAPIGLLGNAIAVVAVGVGASVQGLGGAPLRDATGRSFRSSATVAVPVLKAAPAALFTLAEHGLAEPGVETVVVFPEFARAIHDFGAYRDVLATVDLAHGPIAAIGLAGDADVVKRLTRGLALLR